MGEVAFAGLFTLGRAGTGHVLGLGLGHNSKLPLLGVLSFEMRVEAHVLRLLGVHVCRVAIGFT